MSRAGLGILLLFLVFVASVLSAPLPGRSRSLYHDDEHDVNLYKRVSGVIFNRELEFEDLAMKRDTTIALMSREPGMVEYSEFIKRADDLLMSRKREFNRAIYEYNKRDSHILYRRNIFSKIKHAFQHAFHKVGEAFKKVGHAIKSGFQKAGAVIKKGFQKAGAVMKKGFQKAGTAIKKGFQKVGHFIKTTGAKIAKFGLKIVAAAASVISKVVKFIPGVGQPLSMAVKGLAKGADIASNKIHANLGKKLEKVSHGLDYVISPVGTAAKAAGKKVGAGGVMADLMMRDISFLYDFELE